MAPQVQDIHIDMHAHAHLVALCLPDDRLYLGDARIFACDQLVPCIPNPKPSFSAHNGPCWLCRAQVRMHVHSRSARMGYFPAYHLHYVHGEKYTPSRADIVPARYDALIGAADKQPRVGAELHPSPLKSQVCSGRHCM